MARPRKEFTLSQSTIEFLKLQKNASKTVDEAIELYKNRHRIEKIAQNPEIKVRLHNA